MSDTDIAKFLESVSKLPVVPRPEWLASTQYINTCRYCGRLQAVVCGYCATCRGAKRKALKAIALAQPWPKFTSRWIVP